MKIGYTILTTFAPTLDTPHMEAAWTAYWQRGLTRRLVALLVVAAIGSSGFPALAQEYIDPVTQALSEDIGMDEMGLTDLGAWASVVPTPSPADVPTPKGYPVFDAGAAMQRAEAKMANEWKFLWDDATTSKQRLRESILAFQAYKQARQIYTRLAKGQINISLIDCLPMLEMDTDVNDTQTEKLTVRPVLRPQDRHITWQQKKVKVNGFNPNQLDFDVDRTTTTTGIDPNDGKAMGDLQQQAADDGFCQWSIAQQVSGIDSTMRGMPGDQPYTAIADVQNYYQLRLQTLYQLVQAAQRTYGDDSPELLRATADYNAWQTAMNDGTAQAEGEAYLASIKALDAEAETARSSYSTHNIQMLTAQQRQSAATKNIKEIALKYDSQPGGGFGLSQFISVIGMVAALGNTIDAMGGDKTAPGVVSPEPLGNSLKQTVLLRWLSDNSDQALKLQSLKGQSEAMATMKDVATRKTQLANDFKTKWAELSAADQVKLLAVQQSQLLDDMEVSAENLWLPPGTTPILPDESVGRLNGVGSDQAEQTTEDNVTKIGTAAAKQATQDVGQAVSDTGSQLSWGVLRVFAQAIDAGSQNILGHSFNLTKWVG